MRPTHTQAQKTIAGVRFPTTRAGLVDYARQHGAGQDLLTYLTMLPERRYHDPNEVGAAFAKVAQE